MEAFALYGILAFLLWRHTSTRIGRSFLILISIIMIIVMETSCNYISVHYPIDMVGSYVAGCFWLAAAIWIYQHDLESSKRQNKF